ncbi:MAG: tetratricopeptide repeat protein [Burkholderiales bacterium]|nr:tetratricopeptide repeat protein [Burkholderiales bacterium]
MSTRLTALLERPEDSICLAEAALLVAEAQYPGLDIENYLARIDGFARELRERLGDEAGHTERLGALNQYLFQELGFAPDTDNYYDPRNSFLNEVLERRRGIPLSLSIVYIAVGRRLGLDLRGVSFPGHFLVKCPVDGGMVVLDPYHGGASLSLEDLQKRLREVRGGEVSRAILSEMLVSAAPREVMVRMLRNLKSIYLKAQQLNDALAVLEWLVPLAPGDHEEVRDRGVVYQELECFRAALADFERYVALEPKAADAEAIRGRIVEMQKLAARLN